MTQLAIVATLRPGAGERARALLAQGPPFDLGDAGLTRHTVFLSANEVVFVFEGPEAEWRLDDVVTEPPAAVEHALDAWRTVVEGEPRLARAVFVWAAHDAGSRPPPPQH